MSKQYLVKLTLEVREYDEASGRVLKPNTLTIEPVQEITPTPGTFIRNTLSTWGDKIDSLTTTSPQLHQEGQTHE